MKLSEEKTRRITLGAMLTAIVVILQLLGSAIRFGPFSVSLVLVPIVIGAAMLGVAYGAWLGFVFAATVLLSGDAALFFAFSVPGTIITVIVKGVLAGVVSALAYRLVSRRNKYAAILLAAILCPVVNTGLFVLGCRIFFWPHLTEIATLVPEIGKAAGSTVDGWKIIFLGLIGGNFFFELGANLILAPVIARILGVKSEKHTEFILYGVILTVLGLAALVFSLIKIGAFAGQFPLFERYVFGTGWNALQRYTVMAVVSDIVRIAGVVLMTVGFTKKRKLTQEQQQSEPSA